jgi:hypothetical protein
MNNKAKKALLVGGPIVFVLARRLPAGRGVRLPLLLLGGVGTLWAAWQTYAKEA